VGNLTPCKACDLPFLVLEDLKRVAPETHAPVIDDCAEHFKTYMAYQLRVANARSGMKEREAEQTEEDVVEQLDYMMTFQALYGIETTVKFFGKRGMLLHGTEARFKTVSGKTDTHYFNHISAHDMKQDWQTVLAIFESKVRMLKEIKPHLKRVRSALYLPSLYLLSSLPSFLPAILSSPSSHPPIFYNAYL